MEELVAYCWTFDFFFLRRRVSFEWKLKTQEEREILVVLE